VSDFTESEIMFIVSDYDSFTSEKLAAEIKRRNYKFPHIVFAQSKLETGNFSSKIFKENNNLFGMREARVRVNTATATQHQHAYYNNWRESLEDYGYYYSSYLRQLKTEAEYFDYLSQNYAEDPNYLPKLKAIIVNDSLKQMFNIKK
jgi:flagellum-specific peptidoglycan hydrolase FlgJ